MIPRWPLLLGTMLAVPATAAACGWCAVEVTREVFPPVIHWSLIGLVLYPSAVALRQPVEGALWLDPYHLPTAAMVWVVGLISATQIGPLPPLVMLGLGAFGLVQVLRHRDGKGVSRQMAEWVLAAATLVALAATAWRTCLAT